MDDRVSSDSPSIRTVRGRLESSGATNRPRITLPTEGWDEVPDDGIRLVLDGTQYHADVRADEETTVIRGAYDNARLARTPGEGENRLPAWVDDVGLSLDRSVLVDEVVPGTLYGVRAPGTTATYEPIEPPRPSLSRIAENLDG